MRIRWTRAAAEDLEHIKDYLTEHYPHLAQSTVLELYEAIRSLKESPRRGRLTAQGRSEEHTSELQSHLNLVCRLLLEKKKSQSRCDAARLLQPPTQ